MAGLTRNQLADLLEVTPQAASSWEVGGVPPRWPMLERLIWACGTDVPTFFAPLRGRPREPGHLSKMRLARC